MEHHLTPGKLLDSNGCLQEAGYATRLVREYNRNDIKAPAMRIKGPCGPSKFVVQAGKNPSRGRRATMMQI